MPIDVRIHPSLLLLSHKSDQSKDGSDQVKNFATYA